MDSFIKKLEAPAGVLTDMDSHSSHLVLSTFVGALVCGVVFTIFARKLKISSIAILLLGGILVGPEFLNIIQPDVLGETGLKTIVSIAVGLILFEGGLTLDVKGYRQVSKSIRGVLTKGVVLTWLLSCLIVKILFWTEFSWGFCLLSGSLIIVTGPTVIAPLLKRIRVKKNIHSILHWEGVLIDPIGVFIALLCYEWFAVTGEQAMTQFFSRFFIGLGYGLAGGAVMALIVRRKWVPRESLNIFILCGALAVFALADWVLEDSGLLAVTVSGLVLGYAAREHLDSVKAYKAELIELLIGLLFVLLAARLELSSFVGDGWKLSVIVVVVMFVIRPLNIFVSTLGTDLSIKEKLFLSWIAPRGIVAASMASLFALKLIPADGTFGDPAFLETFAYSVIAATVLFQGFTAGWVGRRLGVLEPKPKGWMIVGGHAVGRLVGRFLQQQGGAVLMLDTNGREVAQSRREGLSALCVNALTVDPEQYPEMYGVGHILAITENQDLNTLVCQKWKKEFAWAETYKWADPDESRELGDAEEVGHVVWNGIHLGQLLGMDVKDLASRITLEAVEASAIRHPERVLMSHCNDELMPYWPEDQESGATLVFHPFAVRLDLALQPNWVMTSDATSMSAAVLELLRTLEADHPSINSEALHRQLLVQDEKYSSLIGYGVALPHAYTDALEESVVLVARLNNPIVCAHTGEQILVIFLVLSPKAQPQRHLKALSEISKFIMREENRVVLKAAETAEELQALFFPKDEG